MQTLTENSPRSSVLVIGPPPRGPISLGVDWVAPDSSTGDQFLRAQHYDVLVSTLEVLQQKENLDCLQDVKHNNPILQVIAVVSPNSRTEDLISVHGKLRLFKTINSLRESDIEQPILAALEKAQSLSQDFALTTLIEDQNEKLKVLYQELEDRVVKRQKFLEESRRKTAIANLRWQTLREAMNAIHKSFSVGNIEAELRKSLAAGLSLSMVRIFFEPHDQLFAQQARASSMLFFQAPLFRFQQKMGSVFFLRDEKRTFLKEEGDFLLRVSEALSLTLDRLFQFHQAEALREQWQATFNAVIDPVVLINKDYEVVQANSAAKSRSENQKKCYQMLFQRNSPCPNCVLGKNFKLESKKEIVDVTSQNIGDLYFNLYHDISDQIRMERKILETAKMAELGTIGSSIAHELNNPLGGILSFVQLIKMDLNKEDAIYPDIDEMEIGVKRCRDIIENLLGFTRNPGSDQVNSFDVREALSRALKITDLQTRTKNIEIRTHLPDSPVLLRGHLNMLSQAFKNMLQLAVDGILDAEPGKPRPQGLIEISLDVNDKEIYVQIIDMGPGQGRRNSLHYSIASQIAHEHGGVLELTEQTRQMTKAKFSFPKSEL
jgi:nitrogen-specific signal transduction histidine kinase